MLVSLSFFPSSRPISNNYSYWIEQIFAIFLSFFLSLFLKTHRHSQTHIHILRSTKLLTQLSHHLIINRSKSNRIRKVRNLLPCMLCVVKRWQQLNGKNRGSRIASVAVLFRVYEDSYHHLALLRKRLVEGARGERSGKRERERAYVCEKETERAQ